MVDLKIILPDVFFKEETRWGHLITTKQKKVWAVELDLLLEFDRVCKELGIQYFLDSGSLLGAVRDGKFIPWDDDIDVIMLRKDYDILIKKGGDCFKYPYFLQTAYSDKGYFRAHAQLRNSATSAIRPKEGNSVSFNQGIFMDIFVLDGLTNDPAKLKRQIRDINRYREIYSIIHQPIGRNRLFTSIRKVRAAIYKKRYPKLLNLYNRLENALKRFSDSDYVDKVGYRYSTMSVHYLKKDWFMEPIEIMFEGFKIPIPKEYDLILAEYYGQEYMKPKNEPTLHGKVLFDTDRSYLDVIKEG